MGAPTTRTEEVHHRVPRCLLSLRDRADAAGFDGGGIELWMEYEHEAARYGVDVSILREELAKLVEASTVLLSREWHSEGHARGGDFARWGRRGGLATLARYGRGWFGLLAKRRWRKITAEQLAEALAATKAGRS